MNEYEKDNMNNMNPENNVVNMDGLDDEIGRIQGEIDKALQLSQPEPQVEIRYAGPVSAEPAYAARETAEPEYAETDEMMTEMAEMAVMSAPLHPALPAEPISPQGEAQDAGQDAFYQETIKNKAKEKATGSFKRMVAAVTAVCMVGGATVGYGIGRGIPFLQDMLSGGGAEKPLAVEQSFVEKTAESKEPSSKTDQESSFAFKDNAVPRTPDNETAGGGVDADLKSVSDHLVDIIDKVEPSVVAITISAVTSQSFLDAPFEQPIGSGSGIVFHEDDDKVYIVTNHHVISNANSVNVAFGGSDSVSARLVGSDADADLAVISVSKSDLRKAGVDEVAIAKFGDSDKVQVGEMVLAIGNALGEGNTATMGIVSTKEKQIQVSERDAPLTVIQTNAAINFGNSGGPLVNMNGEVIGINTAKLSPASGVEGMGYSITSNQAKPMIEEFMNRTNTAFLGISGSTITSEVSQMYQLPEAGVFVNGVFEGSSAEKAGIKRTDIITAVNGEAMFSVEQLTEYIKSCKVGDTISVHLIRDGKTPLTIEAKLEKYNDTQFR